MAEELEVAAPSAEVPGLMDRTLRLVALLRDADEVRAPKHVPCEGKVVSRWLRIGR